MKKIMIRLHHGLGDILCALPAIKAYKEQNDCELFFHCIQKELLYNIDYIDTNIYDKDIEKEKYDKIIALKWDVRDKKYLTMHMVDMFAAQLNVSLDNKIPKIVLTDKEKEPIHKGNYAVFHTQSNWHSRNWPLNKFKKVEI